MKNDFDTLVEAMNYLSEKGYTEDFVAKEKTFKAQNSQIDYLVESLKIVKTYRFDGMTNPDDDVELFAVEAIDGVKGTITMAYGAVHNQNVELITKLKEA